MTTTSTESVRWEMVEAGGRTAQSFGLNRLWGQLYVLLYLHREPLCLDELASLLHVSKASISIACRQLESWGAVRCVWVRGDRRDFYVAETDLGKLVQGGLLSSLNKKLDSAKRHIERSLALLDAGGEDGQDREFLRQRLREAERRRTRISKLLGSRLLHRLL